MKIVTSYMAADGEMFDNEEDCMAHEEMIAEPLMFSKTGNRVEIVDDCDIMIITSEDALRMAYNDIVNGEYSFNAKGLYVWNKVERRYVHWDQMMSLIDEYEMWVQSIYDKIGDVY